jgi:hypothetical protein
MFNFWSEYKKDHEQTVNYYATMTVAYVTIKALFIRLGLCEPTKDIFGSWGMEGFVIFSISFIFVAPYIRTYFKNRDSK